MLGRTRVFYRTYPQLRESSPSALATESGKFPAPTDRTEISSPAVTKSHTVFPRPLDSRTLLRLSWSHLIELIRPEGPNKPDDRQPEPASKSQSLSATRMFLSIDPSVGLLLCSDKDQQRWSRATGT